MIYDKVKTKVYFDLKEYEEEVIPENAIYIYYYYLKREETNFNLIHILICQLLMLFICVMKTMNTI